MHGIKKNVKAKDFNYRTNDNNSYRTLSRFAVVVDGKIDSFFPSYKSALKYVISFKESVYNQDEPWYPKIDIIEEQFSD